MPVLLLAQGDPQAKNLLRQAIEARYGLRPPVIESLRIDFKGRARAKVGPITTWVPVDASAQFRFPNQMRWDFTVRPFGLPVHRGVEAFDGTTYRIARGNSTPTIINDEAHISSMRRRLWAIAALLLTPLGEHFVKLAANGDNSFEAANTQLHDAVNLNLRSNNTLDYVQVKCLNPDTEQQQTFFMRLSEDQSAVNDLMLPCKISTFWDDNPYYEVEPILAESNPAIPEAVFTLDDKG
jgi:hypothetical protein